MSTTVAPTETDGVAFADLPVYEAAKQAKADAELLAVGIDELIERLPAGQFGSDARWDLATDLTDIAERLMSFAILVRG